MKKIVFLCLIVLSQVSWAEIKKIECENGHQIELDYENFVGIFNKQEVTFSSKISGGCPRCNPDLETIVIEAKFHWAGLTSAKLKENYLGGYELSGSYHRPARVGPLDHPFQTTCQIVQ